MPYNVIFLWQVRGDFDDKTGSVVVVLGAALTEDPIFATVLPAGSFRLAKRGAQQSGRQRAKRNGEATRNRRSGALHRS